VFQDFALVNGTWDVKGVDGRIERVRPQDIKTTALFTVEGELDDISGSGQTEAAHGLCHNVPKARQKHLEVKGAGHYGIFSGRRWRDIVYPQVKAFILAHNAPEKSVTPALAAKPAKVAKTVKPAAKQVAPAKKAPARRATARQ
jgi:poly(3-hydroxybutyrate) depolymerase